MPCGWHTSRFLSCLSRISELLAQAAVSLSLGGLLHAAWVPSGVCSQSGPCSPHPVWDATASYMAGQIRSQQQDFPGLGIQGIFSHLCQSCFPSRQWKEIWLRSPQDAKILSTEATGAFSDFLCPWEAVLIHAKQIAAGGSRNITES